MFAAAGCDAGVVWYELFLAISVCAPETILGFGVCETRLGDPLWFGGGDSVAVAGGVDEEGTNVDDANTAGACTLF